jgi:uncharacterized protein (TIGR02246 family)
MATNVEKQIAALEKRVRALEDELEIHRVIVTYGFAVDTGDAERTANLYTEDGVYDVDDRNDMIGRKGIRAMVLGTGHQSLLPNCAHTIGPAVVKVKGDKATATGYSRIYRREGDAYRLFRLSFNRWKMVREDGRWQIKHRKTTKLGDKGAHAIFKSGMREMGI